MSSVNISLKQEAYQRLVALKRHEESFSDEILRLTGGKVGHDIAQFCGMWKDMTKEEAEQIGVGIKNARSKVQKSPDRWVK